MNATAAIVGMGQVSALGGGIDALRSTLNGTTSPPAPTWASRQSGDDARRIPVMRVPSAVEGTAGLVKPRLARRLDGFSLHALQAALLAVRDAAIELPAAERVGTVVATGFGPLASTFAFLDDVIDKGDTLASPIVFARSVHNAPAFNISSVLKFTGPCVTVTGFSLPWQHALAMACGWLATDIVDMVLVGSADELHETIGFGMQEIGGWSETGDLCPLALTDASFVPGDTYSALVLGRAGEVPDRWGTLAAPAFFDGATPPSGLAGESVFLAANGQPAAGRHYQKLAREAAGVGAYTPLWGANPSADALTAITAAVSLADGTMYEVPHGRSAPADLSVLPPGPAGDRDAVHCVTVEADGRGAVVRVGRHP